MTRLRVASLATLFPNAATPGLGPFVRNSLAAAASRDDIDLTIINPLGIPPWPLSVHPRYRALHAVPDRDTLAGAPLYHPRFTLLPRIGGDSNPARIVRAIRPLLAALHAERSFDVIDAQFFFPDGPAAARLAAELNRPLSIKARGADIHYWGDRPAARPQILTAAKKAAGLLAVSAALKADMAAMGMPDERIAVHYTGIDHGAFRPAPRDACRAALAAHDAIPADGALLVTTGALIERKGQALVIAALAQLPGARLALVGSGPDEAALRQLAAAPETAGRVHFLGQLKHHDLPPVLAAADVMVLPSVSEGIANAWIEALACGTPIVISDAGGAAEIVNDTVAGRIAPRDPGAIAAAVTEVLAQAALPEAVAAHAARFSWERNGAQLAAHWHRLAGR